MAKYITLSIFLCFALLTMNFRCAREAVPYKPWEQQFRIGVNISPLKKTYSLTDTIWLETVINGKELFNTLTGSFIEADTARFDFGASFNEFGTYVTNPAGGFCDIITVQGVNTNRQLSQWSTSGSLAQYGCGQSSYSTRIGFKPLVRGTYFLSLPGELTLGSCPEKQIPYYASLSYQYTTSDLGLEIFDALSKNDKGGNDGIRFYTAKINNREIVVFRVE